MTVMERIQSNVVIDDNGCWIWQLYVNPVTGYGQITVKGHPHFNRTATAHAAAWYEVHGPVPDGLELDHLCRVRVCCNPDHLEAVTHAENVRRGAAPRVQLHRAGVCAKGHPMEGDNIMPSGKTRRCRRCNTEWRRQRARRSFN